MAALANGLAAGIAPVDARDERHIDWLDLRPADQGRDSAAFPGMAASRAEGETLAEDLADVPVRIEGYVLLSDSRMESIKSTARKIDPSRMNLRSRYDRELRHQLCWI